MEELIWLVYVRGLRVHGSILTLIQPVYGWELRVEEIRKEVSAYMWMEIESEHKRRETNG